jgi:C-terminal processing protease CtpA/Prc
MRNANEFFWFEYLDKQQTLYFKYNVCRNMPGLTVQKFTEDLLEFIDSHPVLKLVVDLRNNGGGNSSFLLPFINALKERKQINQKGRLYVVVGRQTFSSAVLNALAFQDGTEAVFVGEPTGGKPNHFGEVRGFVLKNSKIGIQYSTKYFTHSKEDTPAFNPEVLINPSLKDYLEYRDPVLEYILNQELELHRS